MHTIIASKTIVIGHGAVTCNYYNFITVNSYKALRLVLQQLLEIVITLTFALYKRSN